MYNLIINTLYLSSVYIISPCFSLSVLIPKKLPLYTCIYIKHHMSMFNTFSRNNVVLFSFDNFFLIGGLIITTLL